jgi:hypothetical protein
MTISEFDLNTTEFVETRVLVSKFIGVVARPREMPWLSQASDLAPSAEQSH